MVGLSLFSMMHGCELARPCVDGTTCVACTLMRISSRRINVNRTMTRHPPAAAETPPCRSSRDSNFESRVEDPPSIGFISKRDHDLEGTLQNDVLASSSDKLSPH